ncbi:MAG: formylglycine-generating enzyme family protein [Treponema sp.]|jgi:formylglycine-generating enzyme required for sulfatase activity|nr:formylglycine-generating enzyme family protein [Treponema sp.]
MKLRTWFALFICLFVPLRLYPAGELDTGPQQEAPAGSARNRSGSGSPSSQNTQSPGPSQENPGTSSSGYPASPGGKNLSAQTGEPALPPEPPYNGPPRLLILPLTGFSKTERESAALFISNIPELNTVFKVLNPRILNQEQNLPDIRFPAADVTDQGILALGRKHHAEYVMPVEITRLGDHQIMILTLIGAAAGRLVAGGYREIREVTDITLLMPNIIKKMILVTEIDTSQAPNLGVFPFSTPPSEAGIEDINVLAHLLIIEIANTGKYKIVRRTGPDRTGETPGIQTLGAMLNAPYMLTGNVAHLGEGNRYFLGQIIESGINALNRGAEVQYRNIGDGVRLMSELAYRLTGIQEGGMPSIFIPGNMVWVPGGSFLMGNRIYEGDEKPVHTVQVNSFFMGKTQVTQREYQAVMGSNPSGFPSRTGPVERVTWYEAIEYCNKLSQKEGLIPAYYGTNDLIFCDFSANGYRLPTEAEWEYAARGGNQDSLTFDRAGGNEAAAVGWYEGNSNGTTRPVGTKKPNSLGLYDMAGNVWEWCWDWYGPYEDKAQFNPQGPGSGVYRVVRGGSWNSSDEWLRSTYRNIGEPGKRYRDVGFRVMRQRF